MNKNFSILGIISILTIAIACASINNIFAQSATTNTNDATIQFLVTLPSEGGESREPDDKPAYEDKTPKADESPAPGPDIPDPERLS